MWSAQFSAGDTIRVSVDTTDEDGQFDPTVVISNEDSCLVIEADNSFVCTSSASGETECPAVEFITDSTGTYNILVSGGICHDYMPQYELAVNASSDPELTLVEEGESMWAPSPVLHEVSGIVTIPSLIE